MNANCCVTKVGSLGKGNDTFSFVFYTEVPIKMYVYCHQEYHWYIVIFRLINEHFLVPILISVSL